MPVSYTPIYRIKKDDLDITDRFNDRCTEIHIELASGNGSLDTCAITVDNRDFRLATPDIGAKLVVELGYREIGLSHLGTFEIDTYEFLGSPHSLKITGTSVGFQSTIKAPAIKEFEDKTLGDILGEIARKGGIQARVHSDFSSIKIPYFNQQMSPMHMLHELERRYGAMAKFQDGQLLFLPRGEGESASGLPLPTVILEPQMFGTYSVRFSERTAYHETKVPYRDEASGLTKWIEQINPFRQGGEGDRQTYLYDKRMNSEAEAKAMAKSMMNMLRRQECIATFVLAKGDPWIKDQSPIVVRNMFDPVNGSYIADKVTHTYEKSAGILTTIEAKNSNTTENFTEIPSGASLGLSQLGSGFISNVLGGSSI